MGPLCTEGKGWDQARRDLKLNDYFVSGLMKGFDVGQGCKKQDD